MTELFDVLAAGGDLSTIALLYIAWRFDKRVSHLEWLEEQRQTVKALAR